MQSSFFIVPKTNSILFYIYIYIYIRHITTYVTT